VTPAGKLLWQTTHAKAGISLGLVALAGDGLGVLVGGTEHAATGEVAIRLARVDGGGAYVWEQVLAAPDNEGLAGLNVVGGPVVLVGFRKAQNQPSDALMRVVDPWGHTSCEMAGQCAKVAACPPSPACKVAWCQAKSGCVVSADSACSP
jgi:hypothetical protein